MKVFDGFQLDLASEFSGLSLSEIRVLRSKGVVKPERTRQGFKYSFSDILVLRLVRVLKAAGIKVRNIAKAHEYLSDINPEKSLASYMLYINRESKSILYVGENPTEGVLVNATQYGQLVAKNLLVALPIGTYLEEVRKSILKLDSDLDAGLRTTKTISLATFLRKYG
ncbi:MAG TPA: MerR family transcriptional regulator [Drouetiella sp.]